MTSLFFFFSSLALISFEEFARCIASPLDVKGQCIVESVWFPKGIGTAAWHVDSPSMHQAIERLPLGIVCGQTVVHVFSQIELLNRRR